MDLISQKIHTPSEDDQKRGLHYCVRSGCKSVNTYRSIERQNIESDIEDWLIRMLQATFKIKNYDQKESAENEKVFLPIKQTTCQKYYKRWSYILYKGGSLGVYKDSNSKPIFGFLDNIGYNNIGDAIQYDIRIKQWGSRILDGHQDIYYWKQIEGNSFYEELPRKKGIRAQFYKFIKNVNNASDNIRINQDNSIIKYYYDAGTIPEQYIFDITTSPSINNWGIALLSSGLIPKNQNEQKTNDEEKKKNILDIVSKMKGKGLIKNDYQDTTRESIYYYDHCWKVLSVMTGIRESREIKKGNQAGREIEYNNFSYEISEDDILQTLQSIVMQWNELFNEKNYIEKAFNIKERLTSFETQEGGNNNSFSILGGTDVL